MHFNIRHPLLRKFTPLATKIPFAVAAEWAQGSTPYGASSLPLERAIAKGLLYESLSSLSRHALLNLAPHHPNK